jgi:hypothetical protein
MGWLSGDDQERFELHLMDCSYCFNEARRFEPVAKHLSDDETIKAEVVSSIGAAGQEINFWSKLRELFWPKTNFLLKPAVVYLMILIILPIAYKGLRPPETTPTTINPALVADLVSLRGEIQTIHAESGSDIIINFAYDQAVAGNYYRVTLLSEYGYILYENRRMPFDRRQAAHLVIPAGLLSEGKYTLIIEDPADTSVFSKDTLRFQIEY